MPRRAVAKLGKISRKALVKGLSICVPADVRRRSRSARSSTKSKEQVSQYVGRGREVVDRGRAQWEDFVERGKNLVQDQTTRVGAAVDAGREAYQANAKPTEPTA